jgi:Zn-dependent peptidase ImmA (M78 family)
MTNAPINTSEIESRASQILKEHGLFSLPVDPVSLANNIGIKVNNAVFSDDNLSGLIAKRGSSISILVNKSDPPYRKRFTIAHELGHHFLHLLSDGEFVDKKVDLFRDTEGGDQSKKIEVQANQFAAALLMPSELVKSEYKKNNDISDLARKFNVSEDAMGYRLQRLRLA